MRIQIINPIEYPDWDELLLTNPGSTFFHTSAWARVLAESYKYRPLYFMTAGNGRLTALVPVMEINSPLTGKRGISLPFTDYCRPIAANNEQLDDLLKKVVAYGQQAGWRRLELRGGMDFHSQPPASATFISHSLDLSGSVDQVFKTFRSSTRRNIKHAARENVRVLFDHSWQAVETFYRLNAVTRKHHGVPPQPKKFFKKVHEHIISKNRGVVALALHAQEPVAGGVFFHYGKKAIFKYGASLRRCHRLRPNNLLMWETIRRYLEAGYQYFSFGKTEPDNKGLAQFKRGWGTRERLIYYYTFDIRANAFIARKKNSRSSYHFFRLLPEPILKLAGNVLYRHVG